MKHVKSMLPAIGIFCFALLIRVIYNNTVAHNYYPLHDSAFYHTIGLHLLNEHCFCLEPYISTVYRAPLWPFIIAGMSTVFGPNDYFARVFLSLIGSGTCVLIYLFARDLFGWRIGVLAGVVAAIYPELYIYDGWLYTESLFTFLLLAVCYVLYRLQRAPQGNWRLWITCGVLLGLLSLTRPNGIIVIGLFIVWAIIMVWQKLLSWRPAAKGVLATTLIALVFIVPWTARNYLVSHTFIPVATGDGTVLLGAYNDEVLKTPAFAGSWINPLKSRPDVTKPFPLYTCFIYLMIVLTIAQGIIFYGSARFRAPIEPMLILLAAGAIWWLTHKEEGTLRWIIDRIRQKDQTATSTLDQPEASPVSSESTIHTSQRRLE